MKTAELKVRCICVLFRFKQFSVLYKFLWKFRVSVLVFEFLGHLELFVWPNSVVVAPGWMNNMQFIKGEATWIVTKNNSTEHFSWPLSSTESMGISSLASVELSSSLLREYCTRCPRQKVNNTWSHNHQEEILGWNERPVEMSCHGRLRGCSSTV